MTMRLRTVREMRGMSLRKLSAKTGIDPGALSRIERGLREPKTSTLRRIVRALGLKEADALLGNFASSNGERRP